MNDVRTRVEEHRSQLVADLTTYIEHESPSNDKGALSATLDWVRSWMTSRLGAPAAEQRIDGGEFGDISIVDYPASAGGKGSVAMLCHYDTVWDLGTLQGWPVTIEGDRLTGPGAFDMKSGLVQAVWAIAVAKEAGMPTPAIRFILNGDEEIGSPASRPVIERAAEGFDAAFVFEASADGKVKTARKGVGIFEINVTGVEGHAGLDPEKGVSAIDEMSRVVRTLHDASDLSVGTTINVGTFQGGTRSNVTAGSASAMVDVRVASIQEQDRIDALLESLQPHNAAASIEVLGDWNRPVMARSAAIEEIFNKARAAAEKVGVTLEEISVGGASDGNFVAALGYPVLDGLGAVGDGAHARHEWISIDGMVERTAVVSQLLADIAG